MTDTSVSDHSGFGKKEGTLKRLWNMIPLSVWFIVPVEAVLLFLLIVPSLISIWLSLVPGNPYLESAFSMQSSLG